MLSPECASHVTRRTSHVTRHTSHVTRLNLVARLPLRVPFIRARDLRRDGLAFERAEEVGSGDVAASVVLGHVDVVVGAIGPVDDVALLGVGRRGGDVVVVHDDDVVLGHAALQHELIGVVHVGLVAVVGVAAQSVTKTQGMVVGAECYKNTEKDGGWRRMLQKHSEGW